MKFLFVLFALLSSFSFNTFASGIQDIKTLECKNEYGSTFSFNTETPLMRVSFLGRQDGLVMNNITNSSSKPIEFLKDYFQKGIIALSSLASNSDMEGRLSVLFAEDQLNNVNEVENLSISFHNSKNNNFYVENLDCVVTF